MCGIIACFSTKPIDEMHIKHMTDSLSHRGPDGEGRQSFNEGRFWLGHRRLSIVDLTSAGKQPMSYLDRYWITYNGEIYNYLELRSELEDKGYTFKTQTDTEVIMAAYHEWGQACFNMFNGMWAFVIYDVQANQIIVSRDRFGVKPLYYYQDSENLFFSSEIKSLLINPRVKTSPDIDYCLMYLNEGPKEYIQTTAFHNINRFGSSLYVIQSLNKIGDVHLSPTAYHSISVNNAVETFKQERSDYFTNRYYELLNDAVKLRMRSDVKIGSALSGGLDSSSIVYLINKQLENLNVSVGKQETFSNVYKTKELGKYDESQYINQVASYLNVKSNQIEPNVKEIPTEHRKMIYSMDTPPESTLMASWYTFKCVASTDVKVTLDGQGADEQLAGYLTYIIYYINDLPLSGFIKEFRKIKSIPGVNIFLLTGILAKIANTFLPQKILKKILKILKVNLKLDYSLNQVLLHGFSNNLVTLLHYADRCSMAYSIESRLPFMDYRLVEFLASIPSNYKIHNGWTKYLARKSMSNKLPDEVTWRKDKMGWPIPEEEWFSGELKPWMYETIKNSKFLAQLGYNFEKQSIEASKLSLKKLIRLLNLAVWYDVFFVQRDYLRVTGTM